MNKEELEFEKTLTHNELVAYLLAKYGVAKYPYFSNNQYKSQNCKVSRTSEGLFCHHIGEYEHIMLCSPKFAKQWSYEKYQTAEHLVYCNYLEHLLLHIRITEENPINSKTFEAPGIGGIVNYIVPELNTFFKVKEPNLPWQKNVFNLVKDNYNEYIEIIRDFYNKQPEMGRELLFRANQMDPKTASIKCVEAIKNDVLKQ